MTKIIIHPGSPHRDDVLSASLVLAHDSEVEVIERKVPTKEEIEDPDIWVLDIGQILNPSIKAFDHHQDNWRECTISLLLKEWDLWESALEIFPWLRSTVIHDSEGSYAVRKELKIKSSVIRSLSSPIEDALIDILEERFIINREDPLFVLLKDIGNAIFNKMENYNHLNDLVIKKAVIKETRGVPVIIFLDAKPSKTLSDVIDMFKNKIFGEIRGGLTITRDIREKNSLGIYRYDADPRIDLNKLIKKFDVSFLHKQEFLAIVSYPKGIDLEEYIDKIINTVVI